MHSSNFSQHLARTPASRPARALALISILTVLLAGCASGPPVEKQYILDDFDIPARPEYAPAVTSAPSAGPAIRNATEVASNESEWIIEVEATSRLVAGRQSPLTLRIYKSSGDALLLPVLVEVNVTRVDANGTRMNATTITSRAPVSVGGDRAPVLERRTDHLEVAMSDPATAQEGSVITDVTLWYDVADRGSGSWRFGAQGSVVLTYASRVLVAG